MISDEILDFIAEHNKASAPELSLLLSKKPNWPKNYIINQIVGRQKAKEKFPSLLQHEDFEFPPKRAIEQASSEEAAAFKSKLFSGNKLLDLTAGMGIDSWYFAQQFQKVKSIEKNKELSEILEKNAKKYKPNIQVFCKDALYFLEHTKENFDLIYLDQDRRVIAERSFKIEDAEPHLEQCLPLIWEKTDKCLLKLSPMVDIQQVLLGLKKVNKVWVYAIKNECKELLVLLEKSAKEEPEITCINEKSQEIEEFSFFLSEEKNARISLGEAKQYIYDPNSAILKAGAFKSVAAKYPIHKLATNTHLYTSSAFIENFPGRCFEVREELKLKKGMIKMANVICKNHPLKPTAFKRKFGIKEGGEDFILACRDQNKKSRVFLADIKRKSKL